MTPEEISSAYEVVANDLQNRGAQEAAKIGNSQSSLGLFAERLANPSGMTSGLANYTYDRTFRPTLNTLTTSLVTQGKANALSDMLRSELAKAKQNYQNASLSSATGGTGGGDGNKKIETGTDFTGRKEDGTGDKDKAAAAQQQTADVLSTVGKVAQNTLDTMYAPFLGLPGIAYYIYRKFFGGK